MKHLILTALSLFSLLVIHAAGSPATDAAGRWSADKANQWYAAQPWPCGFNYVPAHAISYTEMWMPYNFDVAKIDVGCMHWGLVNGRTQTHLAWGARPGNPAPARWQHDLFHGDHTPYAPGEIALFKKIITSKTPAK